MMLRLGDMWSCYTEVDLFLVTANSYLTATDARLAMGRGIAREARDRFPGIDRKLGAAIARDSGHLGYYGLLVSPEWPRAKLGLFQVKDDFRQPARADFIRRSAELLGLWLQDHPGATVALNFPGVGAGWLTRAAALPLIDWLPDTVSVWELAPPKEQG